MKILSPVNLGSGLHDSVTRVVATTSLTELYSAPTASFRAMKVFVVTSISGEYCARELLAIHDGTNGHVTEYAVVSSPDASELIDDVFSVDVDGANLELSITADSATSRTIKLYVTFL